MVTYLSSRDAARDCIDLHRSVLTDLASNGNGGGKLYVYKMNSGFWSQVKNAGYVYIYYLYRCNVISMW